MHDGPPHTHSTEEATAWLCICWRALSDSFVLPCVLLVTLQYNFIQNFPGILTSTTNTFQAMSYSGDGSNATTTSSGRCGCQVCPSIPCGRARTGPAPGPPTIDPRNPTNGAVNPKLEACAGSSGSCMTINGRTCCVGTMSYEYLNTAGPCANGCTNYWSTLSVSQPLVSLWYNVSLPLPKPPTVIG